MSITLECSRIFMPARGVRAHQIVLVYDSKLTHPSFYEKEILEADELGEPFKVMWKRLDDFGEGKAPVYPDGLMELLKG